MHSVFRQFRQMFGGPDEEPSWAEISQPLLEMLEPMRGSNPLAEYIGSAVGNLSKAADLQDEIIRTNRRTIVIQGMVIAGLWLLIAAMTFTDLFN